MFSRLESSLNRLRNHDREFENVGPAALVPSRRPTSDVMIKRSTWRSPCNLSKTSLKLSIPSNLAAWLYIKILKPREACLDIVSGLKSHSDRSWRLTAGRGMRLFHETNPEPPVN